MRACVKGGCVQRAWFVRYMARLSIFVTVASWVRRPPLRFPRTRCVWSTERSKWRSGAWLTKDRRSEGDPDRAAFCDRFPRIADAYVRETIAERCRSGAAAVGERCSDRLLSTHSCRVRPEWP